MFPYSGNGSRKAEPGGIRSLLFQDDPWNAERVMILASASKEASQEQNVFYLSISNWSRPAFNSTLCQYFFEHQTGMHLSNTGCRVNRLNAAASEFELQVLLKIVTSCGLYITSTDKDFLLWTLFCHWVDQNRLLKSNSNRLRESLNLLRSLCDGLNQMNSEHTRTVLATCSVCNLEIQKLTAVER